MAGIVYWFARLWARRRWNGCRPPLTGIRRIVEHGLWMWIFGEWRSLVARFVRDEEAAGSNPVSPTIFYKGLPECFPEALPFLFQSVMKANPDSNFLMFLKENPVTLG